MLKLMLSGLVVVAMIVGALCYFLNDGKLKSERSALVAEAYTGEQTVVNYVVRHGICKDVTANRGKARRYEYRWLKGNTVYEAYVYAYDTNTGRSVELRLNRYDLNEKPWVFAQFTQFSETYAGHDVLRDEEFTSPTASGDLTEYRRYENPEHKPFSRRERDLPASVSRVMWEKQNDIPTKEGNSCRGRYNAVLAEVLQRIESEK